MIQAERIEIRLCEALAEFLCYGTGTIWVGVFSTPMNLIKKNDLYRDIFPCF